MLYILVRINASRGHRFRVQRVKPFKVFYGVLALASQVLGSSLLSLKKVGPGRAKTSRFMVSAPYHTSSSNGRKCEDTKVSRTENPECGAVTCGCGGFTFVKIASLISGFSEV